MNAALFFSTCLFLSSQSFQPHPRPSAIAYRRRDASHMRRISSTANAKKDPIDNDTSYASPWDKMYDMLLLYKDGEGNCNVPQEHKEDGVKLGFWLKTQRKLAKKDKLVSDRRRRREEAGVVWDMDSWRWNQMYDLLLLYKAREGHCNVPKHHQTEEKILGTWLATQRQAMKVGKLDKNRQEQLEAAGVSFVPFEQRWDSMYSLLLDFKEGEGHCDVPHNHEEEDGTNLGTWLTTQRRALKLGKLDKNRQEQLEAAGVSFHPRRGRPRKGKSSF